jgi:hypothetical protein
MNRSTPPFLAGFEESRVGFVPKKLPGALQVRGRRAAAQNIIRPSDFKIFENVKLIFKLRKEENNINGAYAQ